MSKRKRILDDLDADIREHIARETQDNIDRGMPPEEARYAAFRKFGNVTRVKEATRGVWIAVGLEQLLQDVRFGLRMLRKGPGFTAAAVLSLALGIGATTAIFSVVDAVLLRPMPFKSPSRIVDVWPLGNVPDYETVSGWSSGADFLEPFEARQPVNPRVTGVGDPRMVKGMYVTGGFLTFLGIRPELGRLLLPNDGKPGQDHVAMIGYGFWREVYGGDPTVIGRTITVDDQEYQLVGVTPRNMVVPFEADVWLPFSLTANSMAAHKVRPIPITRLIPPISLVQAQQRMDVLTKRLAAERPRRRRWDAHLQSVNGYRAMGDNERDLMILFGCVAFVLAIACVNTANLQLSQAVVREREAAVRAALGASRLRLIRQSLTESILLGFGGGLFGVVLGWWMLRLMLRAMPAENEAITGYAIALDRRVLLFAIGISCITGIIFGLVPALRASRVEVMEKLGGTGRSSSGSIGLRRLRNSLVVAQVALSFALLAGAGLMIKSLRLIYGAPEGIQTQNLVVLNLILPTERYSTGARQAPLFAGIEERVAATPGITGVTVATGVPPDVRLGEGGDFEIEGRAISQSDKNLEIPGTDIEANYFHLLGISLLQGRTFSAQEGATDSGAVIINQKMARHYWPGTTAIGARFRFRRENDIQEWHTVVGVVSDVKEFDLQNMPVEFELFEPMPTGKDTDTTWVSLLVRTAGNSSEEIKAIKEAIWSQDKEIPIDRIATYRELESHALSMPRFYALLMSIFAGIALLLSTIGIYGVISYSTTQRTQEIGIRMALGAQANHVVRMVIREGLIPAVIGVLLGIAGSVMMMRTIAAFLYGVKPADPSTFAIVSVIYLCVALAASLVPARRAARIDPLVALRSE